jgi:hypothetical protein
MAAPAAPRRSRRRARRAVAAGVHTNWGPVRAHRRRVNPFGRRRRSRRRRNPFNLGGLTSGLFPTMGEWGESINIVAAEFAGDGAVRLANKFGVSDFLRDTLKVDPALTSSLSRVVVGIGAPPLLRMIGAPAGFVRAFRTVNIASGIIGMTYGLRSQLFGAVGLAGDYETNVGDYEGGAGRTLPRVTPDMLMQGGNDLLHDYETLDGYQGSASKYL